MENYVERIERKKDLCNLIGCIMDEVTTHHSGKLYRWNDDEKCGAYVVPTVEIDGEFAVKEYEIRQESLETVFKALEKLI